MVLFSHHKPLASDSDTPNVSYMHSHITISALFIWSLYCSSVLVDSTVFAGCMSGFWSKLDEITSRKYNGKYLMKFIEKLGNNIVVPLTRRYWIC